jgi:hypothetical protein
VGALGTVQARDQSHYVPHLLPQGKEVGIGRPEPSKCLIRIDRGRAEHIVGILALQEDSWVEELTLTSAHMDVAVLS